MSLKKQFLKTKPVCKVTFRLSKEETNTAETAHVVGEFNNWDRIATPMKKTPAGNFSVRVDLAQDWEYQYRYLLNGEQWVNDPAADKYVSVPELGIDNSVVTTPVPPKTESAPKKTTTRKKTSAKKTAKTPKVA